MRFIANRLLVLMLIVAWCCPRLVCSSTEVSPQEKLTFKETGEAAGNVGDVDVPAVPDETPPTNAEKVKAAESPTPKPTEEVSVDQTPSIEESGVEKMPESEQPAVPEEPVATTAEEAEVTEVFQTVEEPIEEKPEIPKPEEEVEIAEPDVPSELKGIDTLEVDEPGGNWLLKRRWWEEAEDKMEKIEAAVDGIMDSRMTFFDRRDKADTELFDPFYFEMGMDQGQLEEIANYLVERLEKKRAAKKVLNKEELAFLKTLEKEKDAIELMKKDIEAIRKLDVAMDNAITELIKQINLSRKYKKEARQLFKDIAKVLDHEKARELFYQMDASWQSIKGIASYIVQKFARHFAGIELSAKEQTDRVKNAMADLERKGVSFKEQLKKLEAEDAKQEEETQRKKEELEKRIAQEQEELKEKPGWFASMFDTVASWFRSAWNWVSSLWAPKEASAPEEEVPAVSVEPVLPVTEEPKEEPAVEQETVEAVLEEVPVEPTEEPIPVPTEQAPAIPAAPVAHESEIIEPGAIPKVPESTGA